MTAPRQLRFRAHGSEPTKDTKQSKYWSDPREPIPTNQGQKIENKKIVDMINDFKKEKS